MERFNKIILSDVREGIWTHLITNIKETLRFKLFKVIQRLAYSELSAAHRAALNIRHCFLFLKKIYANFIHPTRFSLCSGPAPYPCRAAHYLQESHSQVR